MSVLPDGTAHLRGPLLELRAHHQEGRVNVLGLWIPPELLGWLLMLLALAVALYGLTRKR